MKKRKLLETLKELIESNAKLTAENEELWLRVGQTETEKAPTKETLHTDEEYEDLLAENRMLSQKLAEAEAKILQLSNVSEEFVTHPSTEILQPPSPDLTSCDEKEEPPALQESAEQSTEEMPPCEQTDLPTVPCAELEKWQIDIASKIIGQALIMITEFTNEISGSSSINKRDLITLALGKSETFKAETVDATAALQTPQEAEADGQKRLEELRGYINALRLSI